MAVIIKSIVAVLLFVSVLALSLLWGRCSSQGHQTYHNIRDVRVYSDLELILNCLDYIEDIEGASGVLDGMQGVDINSEWLFNAVDMNCGHALSYNFLEFDQDINQIVDDLGNPVVVIYFGSESVVADSDFQDLSRVYKAVAWATDENGTMQNSVFLGLTHDGEFETQSGN